MIDVSMLESMLSLTLSEIQLAQFPIAAPGRPVFGPIATKDGWLNLSVASERTFQNLAAAAGRPDWMTDPRFAAYPNRRANWGQLIDELEAWSKTLPKAEVQATFDRHGVPASPYRTVKEAMADPQLAHRDAFAEIQDPGGNFRAHERVIGRRALQRLRAAPANRIFKIRFKTPSKSRLENRQEVFPLLRFLLGRASWAASGTCCRIPSNGCARAARRWSGWSTSFSAAAILSWPRPTTLRQWPKGSACCCGGRE